MKVGIDPEKPVVFIAGGGTGGHIYPGIAIAQALESINPQIQCLFIGSHEGLEQKILAKEKYPLFLIHGGKLNFSGGYWIKFKTLLKLPFGFIQSISLLLKHKPQFVLGVGGYASGPMVLMASFLGFKTAIWEPNAMPGAANRWLSKFVDQCFVVFSESVRFLKNAKVKQVGMPIRQQIESSLQNLELSRKSQIASDGYFTILHYGGSQGSRVIGENLCKAVEKGGAWLDQVRIIHQTGSTDFQKFKERYQNFSQVEVKEFIYDMPSEYLRADLVICRGGASTLTEISAYELPAIIVPLPAADGHQEKNAMALASVGAAEVIFQKDLNPELLIQKIIALKSSKDLRQRMSQNIKSFYKAGASTQIAKDILQLSELS